MTEPGERAVRVLHVGEAANTASSLTAEAQTRGLPWRQLPLASDLRTWQGARQKAERAARGAAWLSKLAVGAARADIVHLHSASTFHHSRYAARRFVLHCHGSDVRTSQYLPSGGVIREALRAAEAVVYATPDLAEHVLPQRPDAVYVPVPIATRQLPAWRRPERPRIAFASRWEEAKGLDLQLELCRALRDALGPDVQLTGLAWGRDTHLAAAAGVDLVPRMNHDDYLDWLAHSTAVVGQSSGALGASDLEALGSGIPLLVSAPLPLYAEDTPPVIGQSIETAVDGALRLLDSTDFDPAPGRAWVERVHGVAGRVDQLLDLYEGVLARR